MTELYSKLKQFGHVKYNEPLSKHTSFKLGGPADFFAIIDTKESFIQAVRFLEEEGIDYMLLGQGTNVVASDDGFRGVIIQMRDTAYHVDGVTIRAAAGCATVEIAHASAKAGLTGFAWGVGVPGTIGGAVRGNAGAMGGEMKDVVVSIEVLRDGGVMNLSNAACVFGYRDSIFKRNHDCILEATLQLTPAADAQGMKEVLNHLAYRNKTQPQGWSSSGCIFKNVLLDDPSLLSVKNIEIPVVFQEKKVIPAGWLVEQAGLKGAQIGGAKVSEKHGNFIVNTGGASATDVFSLIEMIQETVYTQYGITLEEEIQRIE
ncbi:MAG TPA: UDP-N-acetylenolpyruvoylglucosamine reductase [Candidatus Magasanikbacteria bacterium]|nr:MAG: UDP-N-acetylenolpyruvoylglucosamine reductase [Candidatus Magasanikbacteria bacterium RIFCSPLOWO2_02_FULL_47_16]OGH80048.1 MAG: UDP-N-acetylenolpyruvoylglucosamine reductase [Candidatus Magasanikbacteria bacterium RIFCSPHIGHO2_02_FULL_48_18]HAZ28471.1 UDP-N-acetylenolpyruvoylglucosamine reductase [Candidatus Magasanikbacteria bacterium]